MLLKVAKRWLKSIASFLQQRRALGNISVRVPADNLSRCELSEGILHCLDSGVVVVDLEGMMTLVNVAAAALMSVEASALIGKSIQLCLPAPLVAPLMETLYTQNPCRHQEVTLHLTSGRVLPLEYSTAPLYAKSGRLLGAFLMFHDLSHVIESEAEKRRTERLASMGAFVSGIAHEIKNPLVAIKTLAELLPEQYDDEEFRQTFSQVALYEVERIDTLVKRLRGLGTVPPSHRRSMSVLDPLNETIALLSGELTRRSIALDYNNAFNPPPIIGDPDQLKQVFLNLCLNSIEAMQEGGVLRVSLCTDQVEDDGLDHIIIHISDTGPGLLQADLRRIFDPFVTTKAYGSGLGLAISKDIIEHHNGTIQAMNRSRRSGAHFIVRLPVGHEEDTYEAVTSRRRSA